MNEQCILIVDSDILVRNPLAQYLRECGYRVLEAANEEEARQVFTDGKQAIDVLLIDAKSSEEIGFELAGWVRNNYPEVEVVLAGSIAKAVKKAGDICNESPVDTKPHDYHAVHDRIRSLLAARERNRKKS